MDSGTNFKHYSVHGNTAYSLEDRKEVSLLRQNNIYSQVYLSELAEAGKENHAVCIMSRFSISSSHSLTNWESVATLCTLNFSIQILSKHIVKCPIKRFRGAFQSLSKWRVGPRVWRSTSFLPTLASESYATPLLMPIYSSICKSLTQMQRWEMMKAIMSIHFKFLSFQCQMRASS